MQHGGLHHLHTRKRLYKHLSPYPHPNRWKRRFDYVMYGVAIGSPLALVPQIHLLYTLQDASGLSTTTWVFGNITNLLWLVYGFIHRSMPLVVSGLIFAVFNAAILYGIILY